MVKMDVGEVACRVGVSIQYSEWVYVGILMSAYSSCGAGLKMSKFVDSGVGSKGKKDFAYPLYQATVKCSQSIGRSRRVCLSLMRTVPCVNIELELRVQVHH